jgi:nucleotide-binding universal stress UspA family protein
MSSTVIAAVDDSVAAGPVLAAAAAIAPLLGSTVQAVHVGSSAGSTARSSAERAGVPFRTVPGEALAELVALAADGVTAVVVGSRDQPTGETGHLALALADSLPRPLVVVPPQCSPAEQVRSVLVALEGTPGRAKPLRHALQVVAGADLELTVVHVESEDAVPSFSDSAAHETAEFAQEYLRRYWPDAPPARLALPIGTPAEEILRLAEEVHPDLLVAGWPQGSSEEHGHVVQELLRRSRCPVLLVAVLPPQG